MKLYSANVFSLNLILLFLLLLNTATIGSAQSLQELLGLDDLRDYTLFSHPDISPDGSRVAMVMQHSDYDQNRWKVLLELIELETGEHRELTPGRLYVDDPQWSPSGNRHGFLDADEDGPMQLHILSMKGGEVRRLTNGKESVQFYGWSPDGRTIVFGRMDEPEVKEGEERHRDVFPAMDRLDRGAL